MNPITHFLLGWLTAQTLPLERRERAWVTLAGVLPDADGLGIVAELLTRDSDSPLLWWSEYHHVLGHNLVLGLLAAGASALWCRQKLRTATLVLLSFHLHLLGDLVGARGPDGFHWPLYYLWPLWPELGLEWSGQWELNAWPNVALTVLALAMTFYLAWKRGASPLELVSDRADRALVVTLRQRFGG